MRVEEELKQQKDNEGQAASSDKKETLINIDFDRSDLSSDPEGQNTEAKSEPDDEIEEDKESSIDSEEERRLEELKLELNQYDQDKFEDRYFLEEEHAKCRKCRKIGHSSDFCPNNQMKCNNCLDDHMRKHCKVAFTCNVCDSKNHSKNDCKVKWNKRCNRCGKARHTMYDCGYLVIFQDFYDKKEIADPVICFICRDKGHLNCGKYPMSKTANDCIYGQKFHRATCTTESVAKEIKAEQYNFYFDDYTAYKEDEIDEKIAKKIKQELKEQEKKNQANKKTNKKAAVKKKAEVIPEFKPEEFEELSALDKNNNEAKKTEKRNFFAEVKRKKKKAEETDTNKKDDDNQIPIVKKKGKKKGKKVVINW